MTTAENGTGIFPSYNQAVSILRLEYVHHVLREDESFAVGVVDRLSVFRGGPRVVGVPTDHLSIVGFDQDDRIFNIIAAFMEGSCAKVVF